MPLSQKQLKEIFGSFSYRADPKTKGAIIIDPKWVGQNIVRIGSPFGSFPCHKLVAHQMRMLIDQACAEGLVADIGGIWVPRHIMWDPKKAISSHAYGCDIDINVSVGKDGRGGKINYGDNSYQPPRLIELAEKWGFEWGGNWRKNKDGMHFSCVRVIGRGDVELDLAGIKRTSNEPPELRLGFKDDDVKDLQRRLKTKGYSLKVDGIFGPKTADALVGWQKRQGFKASGRVDLQTWRSLGRV